jgi:hypothetical protein
MQQIFGSHFGRQRDAGISFLMLRQVGGEIRRLVDRRRIAVGFARPSV